MGFTSVAMTDDERVPAELYTERRWYACYTRARHEKRVERVLRERGIESYLPLIPRVQQWKDRKKRVEFPLFPSYVFGRFTLQDVHAVLTTPGVSTIVRINGYPTPLADRELENIRRFAAAIAAGGIEPEPAAYVREGDWVRVTDGPLVGVVGIVVERRGRRRVLVGLRAIGQGLEVDIDARHLEPIAPPPGA
ncbi:MAG TPA: UpxY family transcription antiterminator [Longimicrobiales bacterium]